MDRNSLRFALATCIYLAAVTVVITVMLGAL
jgi:hypothetical protein